RYSSPLRAVFGARFCDLFLAEFLPVCVTLLPHQIAALGLNNVGSTGFARKMPYGKRVTLANATCGAGNPAVVHALLERLATCHGSLVIEVDQAGHALAISDFKRDAMHARRSGAGLALMVRRLQCFH